MIIINKADLLTSEETAELTQTLKENSRTGVQVIKSTNGALPIDVLLGQGVAAESDMKSRHELHHHHEHDENGDHVHHEHDHDDFESFGSEAKVKEAGKMRVEGKNYTVKDGDVMHFLFNV